MLENNKFASSCHYEEQTTLTCNMHVENSNNKQFYHLDEF